jgi:hypothetical protein
LSHPVLSQQITISISGINMGFDGVRMCLSHDTYLTGKISPQSSSPLSSSSSIGVQNSIELFPTLEPMFL